MNQENIIPEAVVEEAVVEAPAIVEPVVEVAPVIEQPEVVAEQPKKKNKSDLVAIYSPKKIAWDGVGTLSVGINNVTKEDADKWLAAKYYVKLVEGSN